MKLQHPQACGMEGKYRKADGAHDFRLCACCSDGRRTVGTWTIFGARKGVSRSEKLVRGFRGSVGWGTPEKASNIPGVSWGWGLHDNT